MAWIFKSLVLSFFKIPLFKKIILRCYVAGETEEEALEMTRILHKRGLGIISDFLGEEITDLETAIRVAKIYICHIERLGRLKKQIPDIRLATSIKLTSLGLKFDRQLAARLSRWILLKALFEGIGLEIDIEGPDTFEDALEVIKILAWEGKQFRVALAANQSFSDKFLGICISCNLGVRIVKGAYPGDIKSGRAIDENFLNLVRLCRAGYLNFALATHDKKLIRQAGYRLPLQMLFGIRMFWQMKFADYTYLPWGREYERFFRRRIEEGIRPKVLFLFIINVFESLLWRTRYRSPR